MTEPETQPKIETQPPKKPKGRPRKFHVPPDLDPVEAKRYLNNLYMANHRNNVSKRLGLLKEQMAKCLSEAKLKGTLVFIGTQKQAFGLSYKGGCVVEVSRGPNSHQEIIFSPKKKDNV